MVRNRLREIRISEGITITALSKKAEVSAKVISETERFLRNPTEVTKRKIVKGLNKAIGSEGEKYTYKDVFPEG